MAATRYSGPPPARRIPRKPVAQTILEPSHDPYGPYDSVDELLDEYLELNISSNQQTSVESARPLPLAKTKEQHVESRPSLQPRQLTAPLFTSPSQVSVTSTTSTPETTQSSLSSKLKKSVDETILFAGGLVSHPFESTQHFSILRHSHGLVYYTGPSTSLAITIFSEQPLPDGRSFWLQRKGYSGNMGMATSALLRTTGAWIDVTPTSEALASDLPGLDERAWQRDIKKFLKKAAKDKRLAKHLARETCVIRIPASAADGYLRVVMCARETRKSLCPSPVFRVASTSSDVSIMRGASLTTMPLEVGLKIASVVGTQAVQRFTAPAQLVVQSRFTHFTPKLIARNSEKIVLARSGLTQQVGSFEQHFNASRDVRYDPFIEEGTLGSLPNVIGSDAGPERPFPISFDGKVVQGTGQSSSDSGTPTANLASVPEDVLLRLRGIHVGWAALQPRKGLERISHDWHEAIISIGPSPYAAPRIVARNVVTVHLIHDFAGALFFDAKIKVTVMAFLRPVPKPDPATRTSPMEISAAVARDIDTALASLSRENWHYELTLQRVGTERSQRTTTESYVDMRIQAQKRVDSIPVHWVGVRTTRSEIKDQAYGRGGLYIKR